MVLYVVILVAISVVAVLAQLVSYAGYKGRTWGMEKEEILLYKSKLV